ncbi:prophage tail fiber N-terminal domain-containing protein [Serratia marcescens]|uniref:prophage tail fiber N-terminal domain-containing protein n=2 Tax=Serratia marcescens TaxID=615 RepID=UPI00237F4E98|nr:prophage tail fiber N-terminal domain-containing protein [Serratia marcescens]
MAVLISGKLIGPNGDPRPNVTIMLVAVKTSSAVVKQAPSSSTTTADGSYSLSVEVGTHNVMIEAYGRPFEKAGQITVYSDSKPGTLNDFLTSPGEDELTPAIVAMVDEMRGEAAAYAEQAKASAAEAKVASEQAQSVSDAYPDEVAAQKAVDDGKETRQFFWVRSQSTSELALEYTVTDSRVVPTGRWSMAGGAVTDALNEMKTRVSTVPNAPAGIDDKIAAGVEFADGHFAPLMLDDGRHAFIDENGMLRVVAADSDIAVRPYIESQPYTLPDGAVCTKIIVDPYNNITEAWTEDGGYYFATPDGLKRVGDLKPAAQQIKQATAVNDLVMNYGATRISVADDLRPVMYILPTFGQSLAQGWSTYADDVLIATTQLYPDNAWMFKSDRGAGKENPNRSAGLIDEIVSLKDTVNGGWKETACSSSAAHIISEVEKLTGKRIHILRYVAADGGKAYRNLTRGTSAWSALVQGLIDAKRICERMGFKPVVLGLDVKAGETDTDGTPGMFPELYTRFLRNLDRNYNAEVKRIFGGDHPETPIFVEQCSFQPWGEWDSRVRQGQLDADGLGNIRFTGPGYQYPHPGDVIHINSLGQNKRGVALARAVAFECFGTGFISLKPRSVYWSSPTTIDVYCASSVPIIKDESGEILNPAGLGPGAGFNIRARDGSEITITDVSPLGTTGMRLTVNNPTNTRVVQIGYGLKRTGSDKQSGPIDGARGLIRTTNGITNLYTGETEYQWLAAFLWEIN